MRPLRIWTGVLALGTLALAVAAAEPDGPRYSYVQGAGDVPLSVVQAGAGDAPAILFIHGLGQSHLSFAAQLHSDLAHHYHLVAFDLRGHGNSGKPWSESAYLDSALWAEDIQRVMAATGARRPLVVAWSYGTLLIADYIRAHGTDEMAGLVMIGATGGLVPYPKTPPDPLVMSKLVELHRLSESPALEDTLQASRGTVSLLTFRPMPPEWTSIAEAVNDLVPPYARAALGKHLYTNNTDLVARIHVPVLLMAGAEDKGDPESILQSLSDALPQHATIKVYAETGHTIFAEQPERFNADLADFARSALGAH
jgi:pimeloyl-ACP methyl ester carboxylesterase